MEAKAPPLSGTPRGENEGEGERSYVPLWLKSQGCRAEKFLHTPRRSLRNGFIQPETGQPALGETFRTQTQRRTKVVYGEGLGFSAPSSPTSPSGPGLTEASKKGRMAHSDHTRCGGCPAGGWAGLPGPRHPGRVPAASHHHIMALASPSSRSPACRIPL